MENTKIKEDIAACEKALQVFDRISQQLQETFGGPLNETASRILAEITHEKYDSLLYDQNGNLFVTEGFRKIPLDYVSRGTIDQVYLALRLSAVKIFWPDQDMPLIFDDIFALYDEDRLRSTLFYLAHHYPGQILIFTCHEREARLCRELALPHTVIALS